MARLKVFTWSDGFHAFSVATTSRPKALTAWGVGQDLFKAGLAREIDSGPDYEAAMAKPNEVIQRGEAIDVGRITPAKRKAARPDGAKDKRIKALKTELDALDQQQQDVMREIDEQVEALERRRQTLGDEHDRKRTELKTKLARARRG